MKILILGHGGHGKDTFAEMLTAASDNTLSLASSSEYCAEHVVFPWLKDRYPDWRACFDDRRNNREIWHNLIAGYNDHRPSRLATEIIAKYDIYVGMRALREYNACKAELLFNMTFWVDAMERWAPEPASSMGIAYDKKNMTYVDNNQDLAHLERCAQMHWGIIGSRM